MGKFLLMLVAGVGLLAMISQVRISGTLTESTTDQADYQDHFLAREVARSGMELAQGVAAQTGTDLAQAVQQINSLGEVAYEGGTYEPSARLVDATTVQIRVRGRYRDAQYTADGYHRIPGAPPEEPLPPGDPPVWTYGCADNRDIDLYMIGMGNESVLNNPATLPIPNPGSIRQIFLQAGLKGPEPAAYVTFTSAGQQIVVTDGVDGDGGTFFHTWAPVSGSVTAQVTNTLRDRSGHEQSPRAFGAYVVRARPNRTVSAGVASQEVWKGHIHTFTLPLRLDPLSHPRDITVKVLVGDITDDGRTYEIRATAGSVTRSDFDRLPTHGDEATVIEMTLPNVPGAVTQVDVTAISQGPTASSLFLMGASASAACE